MKAKKLSVSFHDASFHVGSSVRGSSGRLYMFHRTYNSYSPFVDHNTVPPPHNPNYQPIETHFVGSVVPAVEEIQNEAIDNITSIEHKKTLSASQTRVQVHSILLESRLKSIIACSKKVVECYHENRCGNYNASKALPLRYRNMGGKAEYELEDLYSGEVRGSLEMATKEWMELKKCGIESEKLLLRCILLAAKRQRAIEPILNTLAEALISLDSMRYISQHMSKPRWLYVQNNECRTLSPFDIPDLRHFASALRNALRRPLRVRRKRIVRRIPLYNFVTLSGEVMDGFWSICKRNAGEERVSLSKRTSRAKVQSIETLTRLLDACLKTNQISPERTRFALIEFLKSAEDARIDHLMEKKASSLHKALQHALEDVQEAHITDIIRMLEIFARIQWTKTLAPICASLCSDIYARLRSIISDEHGKSVKIAQPSRERTEKTTQSSGLAVVDEWRNIYLDDEEEPQSMTSKVSASRQANTKDPYHFFPKRTFYRGNFTTHHIRPHEVLQLTDVLLRVRNRIALSDVTSCARGTHNETTLVHEFITQHFPSKAAMDTQFSGTSATNDIRDICGVLFSMLTQAPHHRSRLLFSSDKQSDILHRLGYMLAVSLGSTNKHAERVVDVEPAVGIKIFEYLLPQQTIGAKINCVCGCLYAFTRLRHQLDALPSVLSAIIPIVPSLGTHSILLVLRAIVHLNEWSNADENRSTEKILLTVIADTLTSRVATTDAKGLKARSVSKKTDKHEREIFRSNGSLLELSYLAHAIDDLNLRLATLEIFRRRQSTQDIVRRVHKSNKGGKCAAFKKNERESLALAVQYVALRSVIPFMHEGPSERNVRANRGDTNHAGKLPLSQTDHVVMNYVIGQIDAKSGNVWLSFEMTSQILVSFSRILKSCVKTLGSISRKATDKGTNENGMGTGILKKVLRGISVLFKQQHKVDVSNAVLLRQRLDILAEVIPRIVTCAQSPMLQRSDASKISDLYISTLKNVIKVLKDTFGFLTTVENRVLLAERRLFEKVYRLLSCMEKIPVVLLSTTLKELAGEILATKLKPLQATFDKEEQQGSSELNPDNKQEILALVSMASRSGCLAQVEKTLEKLNARD